MNEVRVLAFSATHTNINIVCSYKPCLNATTLWIITEFMEISAAELIRYETLPEELVGFLSHECCLGLSFLHRQNVIHRSVRAEHIFINRQGPVKLGMHSPTSSGTLAIEQTFNRWLRQL